MDFIVLLLILIICIAIIVYCVNKAEDLNRDKFGWGVFAFFFPIIAVIWIQFVDPIREVIKKPVTNINIQTGNAAKKNPTETLHELKEKGIISEYEYEEKHKILSDQLRQQKVDDELNAWYQVIKNRIDRKSQPLIELALKAKKDGLISDQEYENKEKEILAKCSADILKQDSYFDKISYFNLTKPKQDKVEMYLETLDDSELIVLHHNKIKVIDNQRLQEIIIDGAPENFQIIYQNKNAT